MAIEIVDLPIKNGGFSIVMKITILNGKIQY